MSEIDLKEPIFQDQLALSENESLPGNRQSRRFEPQDDLQIGGCFRGPRDLMRSGHHGYRLSETTTSKRSSPLKIGACLLRSTDRGSSQPMEAHPNENENRSDFSFLTPISETEVFQCQHKLCSGGPCEICKGTGFVKGDHNLVKFFEYIIGFKLRVNQSYIQKKVVRKNRSQVNSFCHEFYSKESESAVIRETAGACTYKSNRISDKPNNGMTASYSIGGKSKYLDLAAFEDTLRAERNSYCDRSQNGRASEYEKVKVGRSSFVDRSSIKGNKICNKSDVMDQIDTMLIVHQNYRCDLCETQPIIGTRYHCNDCKDYDLCEQCYLNYEHKHQMQKIDKTAKGKQLQNIIVMLVEPRQSLGRVSLRPPPNIDLQPLSGKTAKSAVR